MWKFTTYDGRTLSDGKSSHGLWPGELIMCTFLHKKYGSGLSLSVYRHNRVSFCFLLIYQYNDLWHRIKVGLIWGIVTLHCAKQNVVCLLCYLFVIRFLAHLAKGHVSFCHHLVSCSCTVKIWAHFDLYKSSNGLLKKFLFFSNSSHLEWRVELSDTILKWDYPCQVWSATWQGLV
jgi:hypothetical protein